jgi:hypothetical protein
MTQTENDVRFEAHSGLKSDIAPSPFSANNWPFAVVLEFYAAYADNALGCQFHDAVGDVHNGD